jgi:cation:H+ antiporter
VTVTILLAVVGLALLVAGGELLIRGASRVALGLRLSPLVVGLTVVAFGTSSPEMAVSVGGALRSQGGADLAVGNVIGSNIFNVLFILGLSAMIRPLAVSQQLIRFDVPLMIGVSLLTVVFALDGRIQRLEGLVLLCGIVVYTWYAVKQSRKETQAIRDEYARHYASDASSASAWVMNMFYVLTGLGLLVLGASWLVDGAVAIATALGVSELIVGLTIVAAGTSMPEVATSIIATVRGERDIAVGNVVGSNIFNVLAVLGASALAAPNGLAVPHAALVFDLPVMVITAAACLPVFFINRTISRAEGALFFTYYIAYTVYLVLNSTQHDALPAFSAAMLWFAIPLTLVTLAVSLRRGRAT